MSTSTSESTDMHTYIVVLREGVSPKKFREVLETIIKPDNSANIEEYDHILNGFFGKFRESDIETLKKHADVQFVEKDSVGQAFAYQNDATWGCGRISRIAPLPISDKPTPSKFFYHWDPSAGAGVDIYIVGIEISHPAFESRASWGVTIAGTDKKDLNGHGTHVAGTAISKQLGVAKAAKAIAVKIMEQGTFNVSDLVKGLDWVITNVKKTKRPSIVNMSIGAATSNAIDASVKKLFDVLITPVAAAGNDNKDATSVSPARSPYAITVGASNIRDKKWAGSNFGQVVNVFAPGEDVESTWLNGKTNVLSGTSMAAPHVSGLLAYLISLQSKVPQNLWAYGHVGILSNIPAKTPNLLIYNNHYDLNSQSAAEEEEVEPVLAQEQATSSQIPVQ